MSLIRSVGQKLHLMDESARPRPPVVMLESRCVTITTQDRSAMGIIPERNHGAYHSFWIPPRDDQTRVRSTHVLFG